MPNTNPSRYQAAAGQHDASSDAGGGIADADVECFCEVFERVQQGPKSGNGSSMGVVIAMALPGHLVLPPAARANPLGLHRS